MAGGLLYELSVVFATVAPAAGLPLSVVAWRRFRGSPFGRALALLPVILLGLTVYHAAILVLDGGELYEVVLESGAFALLVVFVALVVRQHRRLSRRAES